MLARAFVADAVADLGAQADRAARRRGASTPATARRRAAVRRGAPRARVPRGGRGHAPERTAPARATSPTTSSSSAETFHRFAEDKIRPVAEHVHRDERRHPRGRSSAGWPSSAASGCRCPRSTAASRPAARPTTSAWWSPPRSCRGARSASAARSSPGPRSSPGRIVAGRHRGAEAALAAAHRDRRAHGRRDGHRARLRLRRRRRQGHAPRRSTAATASTA